MGLSATFIREWTDPENVMHSGLCKVRLGAIQTAETSDFNVARLPPSGSEGSSRVQNEKSGDQTGCSGSMPPYSR